MSALEAQYADLDSHAIMGFNHDGDRIAVPLISEVLPGLWMGGCRDGMRLPADFRFVLSLYPWEKYQLDPLTDRVEIRLYDSVDVPGYDELDHAVSLVAVQLKLNVKTLVHCQAGLNRSGLITALVLMSDGRSAAESIALLREKRDPFVLCNKAFEAYLLGHDERAAA